MRYHELPPVTLTITNAHGQRVTPAQPFLYCRVCGAEFSADPSDYWLVPPNTPIRHCGRLMRLVERVSMLREVAHA